VPFCRVCGAAAKPQRALHISTIHPDRKPSTFVVCLGIECVSAVMQMIDPKALVFASVYYAGEQIGIADDPIN
jgi:hypothetical protein